MFGFIAVILLLPLAILILFGVSGALAFHKDATGSIFEKKNLDGFMQNLAEGKSIFENFKSVIKIVVVISCVFLVIISLPPIFYSSLIKFYCLVAAVFLDAYVSKINRLPALSFRRIAFQILLLISCCAWIVSPNWLNLNSAGMLFAIMLLIHLSKFTFRGATVLFVGIMIYDVVMVFGTKMMQKAALSSFVNLPVMLMVPKSLSLDAEPVLRLGLGDVVLPGTIVMLAFRLTARYKDYGFAGSAMAGYSAGYLVALCVLYIFNLPQPATIYLMPGAWLGLVIWAWRSGNLKEIIQR